MSHVVTVEGLPQSLRPELKRCLECKPVPGFMLALCGWHENVVASTRVLQRLASQERLL